MWHRAHLIWLLWIGAALCGGQCARGDSGPQPPCEAESFPSYPDLDHSPVVKVWDRSTLGRDWVPPACTGWSGSGFSTLVATAARFGDTSGMESLIRHVGAISQLSGIRYWSTSQKRWQKLILDAFAVVGPASDRRRADFSPTETTQGAFLYFQQSDNLSGRAAYRLRVSSASADRLVFETENVSTIRYLLVPLFQPGEIQSVYFLQLEAPGVWTYYNLTRTGKNANRLAAGHDASSVNRAVAFFRHWASIPTDLEPPAAR
jgi:hypothetical protein